MIAYKYKLYRTDRTKHLDKMLREASFVWNHALALQKRYYRLYKKYMINGSEDKSDESEIFEEIVSMLHCFAMKMYSKRRKRKLEIIQEDLKNEIGL